jgi:hypothetical protein
MKLYELTGNYQLLLEKAEEVEDLFSLTDTLEAIEESIQDKSENIVKLIRNWESDIFAIREEEKRLADRRKSLENKTSFLKEYLQYNLEQAGMDKIKRPTFSLSIQNNPPSCEVLDESLIPSHYMIPQYKVDKKSLLSVLKEGQEVPGVTIKQSKSLRIR